jgi:hypothetical protein
MRNELDHANYDVAVFSTHSVCGRLNWLGRDSGDTNWQRQYAHLGQRDVQLVE